MAENEPELPPEEAREDTPRRFVLHVLPWIVGVLSLLWYLLTLNRWVSLQSVETIGRVSGWLWKHELLRPVTFLLLSPLGLLPDRWTIVAMNLLSAACAALVLGLLARSVVLWPRPARRMRSQHRVETLSGLEAFLPPLLAVVMCGLNLSFWEHATAGTAEMLELLMIAYVIRCVLEYRRDHHESWLMKATFVFSAGLANSWFHWALAPLFIGAVIAVKGADVLNRSFLGRIAACVAAGLSLYLLWPIVHSLTSGLNFWDVLKANLKFQQQMLLSLKRPVWIALVLTCIAPLAAVSIRWQRPRSNLSDDNPASILFSRGLIHLAHVGLMALGLWMALGAAFSPRYTGARIGLSLLPLHYFTAIVVGYCAGYVLLIRSVRIYRIASASTLASLCGVTVVMAVLLLVRNAPQMSITNGSGLRGLASQMLAELPGGDSLVLADDMRSLLLLRAGAAFEDKKHPLCVDTRSLPAPEYRKKIAKQCPPGWPDLTNSLSGTLAPDQLVQLIGSCPDPVFYAHPSFGYFFERFRGVPEGPLVQLLLRDSGDGTAGMLEQSNLDTSEAKWQALWSQSLSRVASRLEAERREPMRVSSGMLRHLRLVQEVNPSLSYLAYWYSRLLNAWGVWLQRAGRWPEAAVWFERALMLSPRNVIAELNLEYNRSRGDPGKGSVEAKIAQLVKTRARLDALLREGGPTDVPQLLELTGRVFLAGRNYRQALECFSRTADLEPLRPEPHLGLGQALLALQQPAKALAEVEKAVELDHAANPRLLGLALLYKVTALSALGRQPEAESAVAEALRRSPEAPEVLSIAAQYYLVENKFELALPIFDKLLWMAPNNPELLASKGVAEISQKPEAAVETFTRALSLAPTNAVIRLNRAVAYLRAGLLDQAEADYRQLSLVISNHPTVLFGQAEIAWRKQDTNLAASLYERYLPLGIPGSAEEQLAAERLRQIKPNEPPKNL
jgi:tetratricopeptide (TPR) repeat protein